MHIHTLEHLWAMMQKQGSKRKRASWPVPWNVLSDNNLIFFMFIRFPTPAIQCARRFFHSYLKETKKKINNQFLINLILWQCVILSSYGTKPPWYELAMGRTCGETKPPGTYEPSWYELSLGRNLHEPSIPRVGIECSSAAQLY